MDKQRLAGVLLVPDARRRRRRSVAARSRRAARGVPRVQRVDARRLDVQLPRAHLRGALHLRCRIPTQAEPRSTTRSRTGARVVVMRVGPGARPALLALARRPGVRRRVGAHRRGRHSRRVPLGRRGLRPLRRRVGRRRRLPGVPQRPVPARHRRPPPDLRHDRRARVPRRVAPPPEPARRDDRERLRLGAAAPARARRSRTGRRRSRTTASIPVAAGARPRVGVAVLRGRPARSSATSSAPTA